MSHDSHAATPAARTLPHVPEARAHDFAVSHRSRYERKRRHAADADAPPAPAASSGSRVSRDHSAVGRGGERRHPYYFEEFDLFLLAFPPTAASPFIRPRRGSTQTLPTAPSIPKSSQVSSNKNQVGRHLSPLPRLLYLTLGCFYPPLTCCADKDTAADISSILPRLVLIARV